MFKIAIVTPYYIQTDDILRQCRVSVLAQTYPCTQIAVADGHPNALFDAEPGLHVVLPKSNRDYGNMPRFIGATLADSYGFDAVAWLDDDNWIEPNHLELLVAAHEKTGAPLVTARRTFRHLDGSVLPITEALEDRFEHVDMNCWLVFRPAFSLFSALRIPKTFAYVCDRIFLQKARRERFRIIPTQNRTVNYVTKCRDHYRQAGQSLPEGAYERDQTQPIFAHARTVQGVAELTDAVGFYPRIYP